MHNLTEEQKAYLAACIDGDGWFSVDKSKNSYYAKICIANTNLKFLDNIKKITGIGSIYIQKEAIKNAKKAYIWSIETNQLRQFINAILPYLIAKIPRGNLINEYLELTKKKHSKWHPRPDSLDIDLDLIIDDLKEYNLRGNKNKYYIKYPNILNTSYIKGINKLDTTQINFICGLIDCEGNISLNRELKIDTNYWCYHLDITIVNTDINLLNYMIKITNIGKIILQAEETKTAKRVWKWELNKPEMKSFLHTIKSNLIIKNRQAEILIETIDLTKIKYTGKGERPKEISDKLKKLFSEAEKLNVRGNTQFYE